MRNQTLRIVILVLLVGLAKYAIAEPDPEPGKVSIKSMSVGELEKAADESRGQKDYRKAVEYLQAALRRDPDNAVLYNKLGMTALQMGDLRTARANFQKAVKRNAKYAAAINNIGTTDFMQKNYGSAARYFKKAVALEETTATFHANLGAAWFNQNKLDRAIAEYTRALELDPDVLNQNAKAGTAAQISSPEERARFAYMMAKVYARQGNVEECLRCLRKAKEDGYHDLANVYKDEEFASLRHDSRLWDVVTPPTK